MATQSLYRRYRPRRFSEVKGQDHVVRALRNSVAEERSGQAYLFSGPRGTGKTTSARILAKVLNCTNPQDGEPCCECESCLAVERGTSYDVHELDAASNNGVESMRDLIEKASLGTPGRHKVYILDEVHMLSKAAEAALLKTLEEPPPHVVFVLATTDPQKMSDTIRSRTQHLQFHLFSADALQEHVRWVAEDAGIAVSDLAIAQVVNQGAGSARDALSALELVGNTGGEGAETVPLDDFVEAMIDRDAGRALATIAGAISLGRDPRTLTEELIGFLRNGFLSIMAPELVQLPSQAVEVLAGQAQRLGAAGLVRGIEQLGEALSEMRHAPDPRVLLDVAIVRLTSDAAAGDVGALVARIAKLEKQVAEGVSSASPQATSTTNESPATNIGTNLATGRATLGGRARRAEPAAGDVVEVPVAEESVAEPSVADAPEPPADDAPTQGAPSSPPAPSPEPGPESEASPVDGSAMTQSMWEDTVRPGLRGMARAVYAPAQYVSSTASSLTLSLPNAVHRDKCEQHRAAVEGSLSDVAGGAVTLDLILGGGRDGDAGDDGNDGSGGNDGGIDRSRSESTPPATGAVARSAPSDSSPGEQPRDPAADADGAAGSDVATPAEESPRRAAERKLAEAAINGNGLAPSDDSPALTAVDSLPEDHEVDLADLVDAPPETVKTPIDRLAEAFPGSELVEEKY